LTRVRRGLLRRIFLAGAWAPSLLFALHLVLDYGLDAYIRWPPVDIPMHFFGGLAIAYFSSGAFRALFAAEVGPRIRAPLELLLAFGLTAAAALVWELAEYASDALLGTRFVFGVRDTMKDMALGLAGGALLLAVRAAESLQVRKSISSASAAARA
jgi:hypothetical protein